MSATLTWPDTGTLATIASVTMAFSASMLFFRIQREQLMEEQEESNWIPWADVLLIAAGILSLIFVILPMVAAPPGSIFFRVLPPAACAVSTVLVAGYTFAILAHYRLILGNARSGPRDNPEPGERRVVWLAVVLAVLVGVWVAWLHATS